MVHLVHLFDEGFSSSDLSIDDKQQVQRIVGLRDAKEMPLGLGLLLIPATRSEAIGFTYRE